MDSMHPRRSNLAFLEVVRNTFHCVSSHTANIPVLLWKLISECDNPLLHVPKRFHNDVRILSFCEYWYLETFSRISIPIESLLGNFAPSETEKRKLSKKMPRISIIDRGLLSSPPNPQPMSAKSASGCWPSEMNVCFGIPQKQQTPCVPLAKFGYISAHGTSSGFGGLANKHIF